MKVAKGYWLLGGSLVLLLGALPIWPAENCLEGRFSSHGTLLLADGSSTEVSHSIQFSDKRFYGLSRQQDVIAQISGHVERLQKGRYQLVVESGDVEGLDGKADDHSLFSLLYSSRSGTIINLTWVDGCLHARETSQVYCRER